MEFRIRSSVPNSLDFEILVAHHTLQYEFHPPSSDPNKPQGKKEIFVAYRILDPELATSIPNSLAFECFVAHHTRR